MSAKSITNVGFLSEFASRHVQMTDRPFCWVLGSGASVQSGIPSGAKLAEQWLAEMHEMENDGPLPLAEWATAANLDIAGFEYARAASFYPWIYQRRFRDYKEQGYAFLEKIMDKAEPSFGYSVLAQLMATTHHSVAITTNFDNLIADALSIYTRTFPLVCGHESLTGYIRPNLRRPLIAKIHRDLLLAPFSNPDEIAALPGEWTAALSKIFDRFTPIIIGYGGNDGSLMNFLKTLPPIEGGIFWCHRVGSAIDGAVHDVVTKHRGRLVPIAGFDELMLQIQEKLKLPSLLPQLQAVHDKRRADYQRQFETLTAALQKPADTPAAEEARKPVRAAAEAAVERLTKEKNWWAWELKARGETDPAKREAIYRAGIEDFPKSAELRGNFAIFMTQRGNYDEAERLYLRAIDLNPADTDYLGNYAHFLERRRKNYDEAERLFRRSIELACEPRNIANLARFLGFRRQAVDEAMSLYRRAVELDASLATYYAVFLDHARQDYADAEKYYKMSADTDPTLNSLGNYAQFLVAQRRFDEAREVLRRSLPFLKGDSTQTAAEVIFAEWLLERIAGLNGGDSLQRLREVVEKGFSTSDWTFDGMLAAARGLLTEDERILAEKIAAAILDQRNVAALADEPLWVQTQAP